MEREFLYPCIVIASPQSLGYSSTHLFVSTPYVAHFATTGIGQRATFSFCWSPSQWRHTLLNKYVIFLLLSSGPRRVIPSAIPFSPSSPANCANCAAWCHTNRVRLALGWMRWLTNSDLNYCLEIEKISEGQALSYQENK